MSDATATPKTTPKTGATATTEGDTEDKKEKPMKEVPLIHDQGLFLHETGDIYEGNFEAKKKDHSVKMHGLGVYTTAEGDVYSGFWDADKLVALEGTTVTYNDGSKYEGMLKDFCYFGKGVYTYPDGSVLKGEFYDNCPIGNLVLSDPNGHTWLGKTELGYAWFEPVNHFYELLETKMSHSRIRRRRKPADTSSATVQPTVVAKDKKKGTH